MVSSSSGGSIYVSDSSIEILIEASYFFNSRTTITTSWYGGGALYIEQCGNIVLNRVCGYQCQATDRAFSRIYANSNNNTVIKTSVSNCIPQSSNTGTMCNVYGFINFSTVNLSHNKVTNYYSGLGCYPSTTITTNTGSGIGTSITYSSFANNIIRICFLHIFLL